MGDVVAIRPGTVVPMPSRRAPRHDDGFAIGARVRDRRCNRVGQVTGTGQLAGSSRPSVYVVRWDGARVSETILALHVAAETLGMPGPVIATLPGARTLRRDADGTARWSRGDDTDPTPPPSAA